MAAVAPSYQGFRDAAEIISHCVWLYHRFPLSFREVEEMMMERSVVVSRKGPRLELSSVTMPSAELTLVDQRKRSLWPLSGVFGLNLGIRPIVSVMVLAQAWRGTPHANLSRLLRGCQVTPDTDGTRQGSRGTVRPRRHLGRH
jgi:hypothetical protein